MHLPQANRRVPPGYDAKATCGASHSHPFRPYLLLGAVFIVANGIAALLGYRMSVDSTQWQFLDPVELRDHLSRSLLLLHTQPLLLNAVLGLIYKVSALFHVRPEVIAKFVFLGIGWAAVVLLFKLIREWTRSEPLGIIGACLLMADPTFHFFLNWYFYEFPLLCLSLLLLWLGIRYFRSGSERGLFGLAVTLGAFTLLRHLFPPIWALFTFALLVLLGWLVHPRQARGLLRHFAAPLGVLLLLTGIWPLKNQLIFGRFFYTSLSGYNLARNWVRIPDEIEALIDDRGQSGAKAGIVPTVRFFAGSELTVLTSPKKSGGGVNVNHFLFLKTDKQMAKEGISARLHHLKRWLGSSAYDYVLWSQPPYMHPYLRVLLGPQNRISGLYLRVYTSVVYFNLNGIAGKLGQFLSRRRVQLNLYGALLFPASLALAFASLRRLWRTDRARFAALVLLLWVVLFPMTVVCMTDGTEGCRMRAPSVAVVIVLMFWLIGDWLPQAPRSPQDRPVLRGEMKR